MTSAKCAPSGSCKHEFRCYQNDLVSFLGITFKALWMPPVSYTCFFFFLSHGDAKSVRKVPCIFNVTSAKYAPSGSCKHELRCYRNDFLFLELLSNYFKWLKFFITVFHSYFLIEMTQAFGKCHGQKTYRVHTTFLLSVTSFDFLTRLKSRGFLLSVTS